MPASSPVVLIHSTLCWPLAARLAICFRDLGCRVHSICPPAHPLHFVRGIERCCSIRSWSVQHSLIKAIEATHADYIVPTDDRAIWQLHALTTSHPQYGELVVRSLGDSKNFEIVRSRVSLLTLAESLQIRIPRTVSLGSRQEATSYAQSWSYPALVKRDGTFGGRGVAVVGTPRALEDAFHRLGRNASLLACVKRRLVDDDVLAFSCSGALSSQEISLQKFVAGTPANAMYSCFRGALLASLQVRTICAQHATGAALIVERMNDPKIEEAGRRLAKALSLSGFFGLDFLLEDSSGYPYLLEMNPRATQLGHLPLGNQGGAGCLAEALWLAWTGNGSPRPASLTAPTKVPQRIAFYPQSLVLGANSSLLASAWLDRPDDEPILVRELSQAGWPERRLLYRLFHRFYAVPQDKPVVFSDLESGIKTS
jgi:glutathione synthase/RimK-type ligase-like ATP-grasp enzyme